uniref:NADH dehydrogenase subunit 9 n=1 Tax=Meteora sporadica TaxID=2913902 RepID=UPI003001F75C|nr:NADH dehydrogenase subunit 9 [Meteora sporadica]WVH37081.1 NADH dehydrogenase subunit 9 [Meteora sporadica]
MNNTENKKINTDLLIEHFGQSIMNMLPRYVKRGVISKNELTLEVDPKAIHIVLLLLNKHTNCQFKSLIDMTAVDYPSKKDRFEVHYMLLTVLYNNRIKIKTRVNELKPLKSATSIYKSAGWMERETWDMFGVYFYDHPDLRRILTDYGFQGYPLRKDFPLSGYTEVRYDDTLKRVISEPVEITQEYRYFDFVSPWESSDITTKIIK